MEHIIFFYKRLIITIIFVMCCAPTVMAQEEKSTVSKIDELRSNANFTPQNPEYIDLILKLAKSQIRTNTDSTELLLKEGYQLSLDTNYKSGESTALSTYGYFYFEKGEIDKAYEYNMNALKIANTHNLSREKLRALNNMGLDYWLQGKVALALTKFLEALAVAKEAKDVDMMVSINVNIANIYSENDDYETALAFLKIARQLNIDNNNEEILAYTQINMASAYSKIGNYTEANIMVDNSIAFFKKEHLKDWMSHGYEQKGSIALIQNDYSEALKWLSLSEELCDEINFKYGYTLVYNALAKCHLGLKNIPLAEQYALKGLAIATELEIALSIKDSNLVLSKIYHEKGQNDLAYTYQTAYMDLYEKESTEKFKKGLGILRSKTEFENQKKLLIEKQQKAIAKQKNYVYIAIAAFIIASLFLILIYRNNKLQKKYTENLQEKQEILLTREIQLSESNTTKDKLFSIIAHDLKGPINSFYMLMKMTSNEAISKEDYNTLFPQALRDIQGISEMLNNLLVWARTQMEGIVLKPLNVDIHTIVRNTISVLSPLALEKEISVINTVPENTLSFSDTNHLNIIIRNLISNAIKFTNSKGEISINVTEKDNELQLEVTDNGIGMDQQTQSLLFEKKHMKSTYGTNNEKGTGLGLSICKEMVENNGGKLWVSSIKNEGTSIFFTIPLQSDKDITV
ncbi:tetratricopeptide repeat-containing sensor histidine kinase [Cellulophaga sp. E16_2]|uniref:tetratricopeptide repeat-containing sensor histidine kinase n=1 Tax=Cellulophaga sp. E16_2 TaxID=2789297 RepID=UPI001A92EC20|nr:ATP-binding protein [Cellulophaga sp. E16_2]MBO0593540.1 tetratricopeptide repeat-containing sensor histidine kinase [Cellulophaga sp. E16_2]